MGTAIMSVAALPAVAQVATDGSLGTGRLLNGPNVLVPAALGRSSGANLFHSFSYFNVGRGESVTFTDLAGIANVVARVTGGARSEIFGSLRVEGNAANLYLLNPAGFLFGAGASLNVPAAFYATSAHELRFADGARFTSQVADGVTLSRAAPGAFVFHRAGGVIEVAGATLATRPGATLGLFGGGVTLERGSGSGLLSAPSGRVAIAALGGGEVSLSGVVTGELAGRVAILNGTRISVAEGAAANAIAGSGSISIRAGEIVLDHSRLDASTRRGAGGTIDLQGGTAVVARGAEVLAITLGAGDAGNVRIAAPDIAVDGGSLVDTSCDPGCTSGNAGSIDIVASRRIAFDGDNAAPTNVVANSFGGGRSGRVSLAAPRVDLANAVFVQSVGLGAGDARGISISGGVLTVSGGAQVAASSRGSGRGGAIDIAVDEVRLEGFREESGSGAVLRSGLFANAEGSGDAGGIDVRAAVMRVLAGAEVSASAAPRATGNGGTVRLIVDDVLEVAGYRTVDAQGPVGPSAIVTNTFGPGRGGDIVIDAGSLVVRDRAVVQSQSEGRGDAGAIRIDARDVTVAANGAISSRAGSTGRGGSIQVRAEGTVLLQGANTGVFAETVGNPAGAIAGSGGTIDIEAARVHLADGAVVFASSSGSGNGGGIAIRGGEVVIDQGSRVVSESLGTTAQLGNRPGLAGDVAIDAGRALRLDGGVATRTNEADGGNVDVRVGDLALLVGGRITTAVGTGRGDGGNVELRAPTLVMLDAVVNANAFGGSGGNIHVAAPAFIFSPRSLLTASSELGIDGVIQVESPALDVAGVLGAPAPRYLQSDLILAGRCQARLAGKASALAFAAPRELSPPSGRGFLMSESAAHCAAPPPRGAFVR